VKHAIKCGYRHFDTAWTYPNKTAVASAIAEAIEDGLVIREDLFLTHKVGVGKKDVKYIIAVQKIEDIAS